MTDDGLRARGRLRGVIARGRRRLQPYWYLVLGAVLFGIGAVGLLVRRNPLVMFMCVELMLNAVNLTFVTFARMLDDIGGQVIVFFVLVVAAAEVVVGLGIIVAIAAAPSGRDRRRHLGAEGLGRGTHDRPRLAHPCAAAAPASCVLLCFGRRLGEPLAGWLATADGAAPPSSWPLVAFVDLLPRAPSSTFTQHVCSPGSLPAASRSTSASSSTRCRSRCACSSPASAR